MNRVLSYAVALICIVGVVLHFDSRSFFELSRGTPGVSHHRELRTEGVGISENTVTSNVKPSLMSSPSEANRKLAVEGIEIDRAKDHALRLADLIHNRYELQTWNRGAYFYITTNIASSAFDVYKYRMAKKIMQKNSRYLMLYGGSSVTAGHDGQFNSSFSQIADKRLRPILEALGIEYKTDNFAQSANNCIPYGWCYETMGEKDPDWVNWEQSYNCGHDSASFELTGRVAGQSKNRGAIWYSASGAFSPIGLPPSEFSPPWCAEEWTVESVQAPHTPLTHWYPTKEDIADERRKLDEFHSNVSCTSRFINDKYTSSLSPSGFNVWSMMSNCPYNLTDKHGKPTYATHNCDASNFMETVPENVPYFFSHEGGIYDNPSGRGAGHHPPKAFHMWRGEAIAYIHVLAILDAIYMIEEDIKTSTREQLATKYADKLEELQGPLPPPMQGCDRYYCQHRATCYTDFNPHASETRYLHDLFVGKMTWSKDDLWKTVYHNTKSTDPLYLKFERGKTDIVLICGGMGESLKHTTLTFDFHGGEVSNENWDNYSFETRDASRPPLDVWTHRRYIGNECTELSQVPEGTHILQISRNETLKSNHVNSVIDLITFD